MTHPATGLPKTAATGALPPLVPRRRRLVLATLCAGMFMAMLDNVVVSNALPRISEGLGAGLTGLQWAVEGYSLVFAALLLPGGALGDRFDRRLCYLGGTALFTLGSAACALAPSLGFLVAARAAQGAGAALLVPQSLAILRATYTEPADMARAFAAWSGISALGLALGPAIGGPLVEAFGWPSAFWINVPIGALALALGARAIPRRPGTPPGQAATTAPSPRAAVAGPSGLGCAALGLAALVYGLIEGPVRGWTSLPVVLCLTGAAAAAAFVVATAGRGSVSAVDPALFRDRIVAAAVFAGFAVTFAMFGVITYLGLFMQDVLGWSPTGAGLAALPSTALIIALSPVASRLTLRHGPALPLCTGLLCCAAALGLLSLFGAGASYVQYWWALPLMGAGMGLCYTPVTVVVMTRVPLDRAGHASAVTNTAREVGGVAGIALMGTLLTTRFHDTLRERLLHAGVPADTAREILTTTTTGGAGGISNATAATAPLRSAVAASFVDGLHLSLWTAAALLLLATAVVARTPAAAS
ncbi:MFS transporter [Streptomyces sp. NPDC001351]|uniref:MFS transporter n=1 Tax=Streptomyces sp. NPDC001351 TaxID=3364564 RepID=UPI0036C1CD42